MKVIKLTESQLRFLMQEDYLDSNSDIKKYSSSEVSTTSNVPNSEGDIDYGEETKTDNVASSLSTQHWYRGGLNNGLQQR